MNESFINDEIQIVNIILIAIGLLLLMSFAIVLFFYFSRKKIIKTQLEKAELEIEYQKELLQNTIVTQEEERQRIAQDLHDAISSKLNVVSLNANFLTDKDITPTEANKIGESIHKVTSTVLENSRRIAHDLLPPTLDKFGLQAAVEELCEEIQETKNFTLEYHIQYQENFISSANELHLFRILQELFSNTIKHSGATNIQVALNTEENLLSLQYTDNGKGFNLAEARSAKGLGMSGIENRAILMNATCDIESSQGNGIKVSITSQPNNEN
ncbi:sensor histidine kinase [Aureisphaera sp. CAU 1614]|uniref:histidine kinase n=1 Tax=Halomarinibacterium sedimenti TaxID=2857106 RepID=A0A9X1FN92_9FLAO|nr:sensor histidine kinase [Halomarinibacterium sedimenti]MBW2937783.1 sensor histidine kinase [Halomarinibacterium sedimenti]